jgi:hypothetical protein
MIESHDAQRLASSIGDLEREVRGLRHDISILLARRTWVDWGPDVLIGGSIVLGIVIFIVEATR